MRFPSRAIVEKIKAEYPSGTRVELVKMDDMGMIFREQPTDDYGIDAQIETIENGYATGKLIAVQIKSGESYFSETTSESIIYRGERKHYDYWLNHSLPVIIVLCNPTNDTCYWNVVNSKTAKKTEKNWKIEIPFSNLLKDSKAKLVEPADNLTEYEKKFNAFLFAKPWMKEVISGNKVVLNVEEWINKSSGRGEFKLRIIVTVQHPGRHGGTQFPAQETASSPGWAVKVCFAVARL